MPTVMAHDSSSLDGGTNVGVLLANNGFPSDLCECVCVCVCVCVCASMCVCVCARARVPVRKDDSVNECMDEGRNE